MQSAINAAVSLAEDRSSTEITTFHVLSPLLEDKEGILIPLLDKIGAPVEEIRNEINGYIDRLPKIYGDVNRGVSRALQKVLQKAEKVSVEFKDEYVSTEHFLLAALREDPDVKSVLTKYGIDEKSVLEALKSTELNDAQKAAFLDGSIVLGSSSGLNEIYSVLKGIHRNDYSKELAGLKDLFSVTYDPAMIEDAIDDMINFLSGKTHIIDVDVVDKDNVNDYVGFGDAVANA